MTDIDQHADVDEELEEEKRWERMEALPEELKGVVFWEPTWETLLEYLHGWAAPAEQQLNRVVSENPGVMPRIEGMYVFISPVLKLHSWMEQNPQYQHIQSLQPEHLPSLMQHCHPHRLQQPPSCLQQQLHFYLHEQEQESELQQSCPHDKPPLQPHSYEQSPLQPDSQEQSPLQPHLQEQQKYQQYQPSSQEQDEQPWHLQRPQQHQDQRQASQSQISEMVTSSQEPTSAPPPATEPASATISIATSGCLPAVAFMTVDSDSESDHGPDSDLVLGDYDALPDENAMILDLDQSCPALSLSTPSSHSVPGSACASGSPAYVSSSSQSSQPSVQPLDGSSADELSQSPALVSLPDVVSSLPATSAISLPDEEPAVDPPFSLTAVTEVYDPPTPTIVADDWPLTPPATATPVSSTAGSLPGSVAVSPTLLPVESQTTISSGSLVTAEVAMSSDDVMDEEMTAREEEEGRTTHSDNDKHIATSNSLSSPAFTAGIGTETAGPMATSASVALRPTFSISTVSSPSKVPTLMKTCDNAAPHVLTSPSSSSSLSSSSSRRHESIASTNASLDSKPTVFDARGALITTSDDGAVSSTTGSSSTARIKEVPSPTKTAPAFENSYRSPAPVLSSSSSAPPMAPSLSVGELPYLSTTLSSANVSSPRETESTSMTNGLTTGVSLSSPLTSTSTVSSSTAVPPHTASSNARAVLTQPVNSLKAGASSLSSSLSSVARTLMWSMVSSSEAYPSAAASASSSSVSLQRFEFQEETMPEVEYQREADVEGGFLRMLQSESLASSSQPPPAIPTTGHEDDDNDDDDHEDDDFGGIFSLFKADEFQLASSRYENATKPMIQEPGSMTYSLSDDVKTVFDVLLEWRFGFRDQPAIQDLNVIFPNRWWNLSNGLKYKSRTTIVREYVRRVITDGQTDEQAIHALETLQGNMGLVALAEAIRNGAQPKDTKGKRKKTPVQDQYGNNDQGSATPIKRGKANDRAVAPNTADAATALYNDPSVPFPIPIRDLNTIADIWKEWTEGWEGDAAIDDLVAIHGKLWRINTGRLDFDQIRTHFSYRNRIVSIIREAVRIGAALSIKDAINTLENAREPNWSLPTFLGSRALREIRAYWGLTYRLE
ncbi:hypothetical protein BGZ83_001415 [Gryganskiella cystojenkinii]|nr:hypothetical protein BGZ83_001415 [Gryganskiella cystojenkinii]